MYTYRNKITGAEVKSITICTGDSWELVSAETEAPQTDPSKPEKNAEQPKKRGRK